MPRPCATCAHSQRIQIEGEFIAGRKAPALAKAYGLDRVSLHRHLTNHLPAALNAAAAAHLATIDAGTVAEAEPSAAIETSFTTEPPRAMVLDDELPAPAAPQASPQESIVASPALIPPPIIPPAPSAPPLSALGHLELARALRDRAFGILDAAEASQDRKTALAAIREARGVLEHLSRLEPAGGAGQAVPLAQSPEWHQVRTAIIAALVDFPEARLAVASALAGTGALQ